jgi:peptide/nickel transport system permease protein
VLSAVKKGTRLDRGVTLVLFMLYSLPSFFVGTLSLFAFSAGSDVVALRWFPTGGWASRDASELTTLGQWADIAWHLVLPMIAMTYGSLAALSRYMRTGLLDVIQADYVRTARAKGLSERWVIGKHALRNGLLPILTLLGGLLPAVLGGSVIVEYIFGIPGMGLWVVDAINQRDYNVILAVELFSTILVLVGLLLTDLSYALVDPRIRFE